MSEVGIVSGIMEEYGLSANQATKSNDLDKDAFLNLLATQMKYQDPLEPTKNEEMLAQMAQFSALEQMQNLNTSSTMQQAYNLMGKTVLGIAQSEAAGVTEYVQGVVEAVTLKNGEAYLRVDGKDVALAKVEAVLNESTPSQTELVEAIEQINETLVTINEKIDAIKEAAEQSQTETQEAAI